MVSATISVATIVALDVGVPFTAATAALVVATLMVAVLINLLHATPLVTIVVSHMTLSGTPLFRSVKVSLDGWPAVFEILSVAAPLSSLVSLALILRLVPTVFVSPATAVFPAAIEPLLPLLTTALISAVMALSILPLGVSTLFARFTALLSVIEISALFNVGAPFGI